MPGITFVSFFLLIDFFGFIIRPAAVENNYSLFPHLRFPEFPRPIQRNYAYYILLPFSAQYYECILRDAFLLSRFQ